MSGRSGEVLRRGGVAYSLTMPLPATPDELDAAWLEDVLRRGGAFPSARVRSVAHEIIGVGFGLDGTCARLTLDGDGVPATLVAKWCSPDDARRETSFYRDVAPRLDLRLATLHASAIDAERGLVVTSDVAPARQGDTLVGATAAESDAMTDAMASMHAAFWDDADAPALAGLPRWTGEVPGRKVAEALPKFVAEWSGRLAPAAIEVATRLPEDFPVAVAALLRAPPTLVHTDLHLDNVLFLADGTPVILDWTDARRGPAALDFARLLVEQMTSAARRERQERLTRRYVAALAARGVTYDVERLRADIPSVVTVMYAAVVRWAAGSHVLGPDVPRVPLIFESVVRNCADAATDPACA
jgi:hypothetical protein